MSKTYIDNNGYRRFCDSNKLVHRWVGEKKHGNEIWDGYEVHHIDGDKLNNSSENLTVLPRKKHRRIHFT